MNPLKSRTLHDARVIGVEDITPKMRRVTVAGDALKVMPIDRPAMWMKLFFPMPSNIKPQGRAYTIRAYNAEQGWMAFDFALHGDQGPAAWWIARVREGVVGSAREVDPDPFRQGDPTGFDGRSAGAA